MTRTLLNAWTILAGIGTVGLGAWVCTGDAIAGSVIMVLGVLVLALGVFLMRRGVG